MMTAVPAMNDLLLHNGPLATELAEALTRVLHSGWYVLGTEVAGFEREFAEYCGASYAVGVANGTDALELALVAVGVRPGQRVALAANAGGYGSTAVHAIGATGVYVDVEPETYGMCPAALRETLRTHDVGALVATHLYGRLCDIAELAAVAAEHGVPLVEDCAQAHGASRAGRRAGTFGDAAAFSFYPTKNLGALGDAGAVVTNDQAVARRVTSARQYGWDGKYRQAVAPARNSRLDEVQAAVLRTKLPYLDGWNAGRAAVAARYAAAIEHPKVVLPDTAGTDHVAHLYVVRTAERDDLAAHLRALGIPYDVHYPLPDHRQPAYGRRYADVSLPVTERLCAEVLTLPCYPELTADEVDRVADAVNRWGS